MKIFRSVAHPLSSDAPRVKKYKLIWSVVIGVLIPALYYAVYLVLSGDKVGGGLLVLSVCVALAFTVYSMRVAHFSVMCVMAAFFFSVSYPLRYYYVASNLDEYTLYGGFASIGIYDFSMVNAIKFHVVSFLGVAGLILGIYCAIRFSSRRSFFMSPSGNSVSGMNLSAIFSVWLMFSLLVGLLCLKFQIGRSGISPVALPFKLTGVLNHLRSFVLPMLGWVIFGQACERNKYALAVAVLLAAAGIGVVGVFSTLSKASVMYALIPYMAFMYFRFYYNPLCRSLLFFSTLFMILALPVSYFGAMVLRDEVQGGYEADRRQVYEEYMAGNNSSAGGGVSALVYTVTSVFARVTGGSELMAVVAAPTQTLGLVGEVVFGQGANADTSVADSFKDVFNVTVGVQNGQYSGKSYGLWAALFLSHSYVLVFLGSVFFGFLLCILERSCGVVLGQSAAVGVAFWFLLAVWESGFDVFWPQFFLLVVILVTLRMLVNRKIGWRPRVLRS